MDEREFIQYIEQRDRDSLAERVERWRSIASAIPQYLPRLLWEYLTEMNELYVGGHSTGVILFCAALIEGMLRDQLSSKDLLNKDELDRLELGRLSSLSGKAGLINQEEEVTIDEIREARNKLIHLDTKGLGSMAKMLDSGFVKGEEAEMWWTWEAPEKALKFLTFTRKLAVKFYGVTEPGG